jgi:hypothetical protein
MTRKRQKPKNKKGKPTKKTTTKQKRNRQHVPVEQGPRAADPVTRGGLPPGLVPALPQLDVERLLRPVAEMASALGQALVQQPAKAAEPGGSRKTTRLSEEQKPSRKS